jgi:hypothetical protein
MVSGDALTKWVVPIPPVRAGHYERLRGQATIFDFIPLLVYRSTKDELLLANPERLHDAA